MKSAWNISKNDREKVPKLLMTNLFLCTFSGSELHILSIAEQFIRKGYEVTIAVFEYAYPLLSEAEKIGVKIINCVKEDIEDTYYDVFWSQHYMVADYVILKYKIKCKKLVVSKLGVTAGPETLPVFAKHANLITCVSEECKKNILNTMENGKNIYVFENYATEDFFKVYKENNIGKLKNIAIISNHIPDEVIKAKEVLEMDGKCVQCFGTGYRKELITPEILEEYDLIITIGKTVQWGFATGTPVYVYDIFGGPGYIDRSNIDIARENNFSGRGFNERKNSEQIFEDIINGYDEALSNREYLNQIARDKFDLTKKFKEFYSILFKNNDLYVHDLSSYYSDLEKIRCYDSAEAYFRNGRYCPLRVRVYFDKGKGIGGDADEIIYITPGEEITLVINIPTRVKRILFKPCEHACEVEILSVSTNDNVLDINMFKAINTFVKNGKKDLFFTNEASYIYENSFNQESIQIIFVVKKIDEIMLYKYINETFGKNNLRLKEKLQDIENQYNVIANSTIWKVSKPIRNIMDRIKRMTNRK